MWKKFRYHSLILCALALTIGGAFAAWQFGGDVDAVNVELEPELDTDLPAERWNFDYAQVEFRSGDFGDFGVDEHGEEITSKTLSAFDGRQVTYGDFETLNLNVDEGYLFTRWVNSEGKPFEIDVIRNNEDEDGNPISEIYTAEYIQITDANKDTVYSLYDYQNNLLGTFVDNPNENGSQQILYNIKLNKNSNQTLANQECYYIKNYSGSKTFTLKSTSQYNVWGSSELIYSANNNNVKNGVYYIIFDPVNTNSDLDWHAHGGHVCLYRLYQYSIVGDPSNTWDSSANNLVTFGYERTQTGTDGKEYKVYKADNVFFNKDFNFEFKLNEKDDYPYLTGITLNYSDKVIVSSRVGNTTNNLTLNTSIIGTHDYYMMSFYINVYEHPASGADARIYNEPYEIYLSVEIMKYNVYLYSSKDDITPYKLSVNYNDTIPFETVEDDPNYFYDEYLDKHTDAIYQANTPVYNDMYIYPNINGSSKQAAAFYIGDTFYKKYLVTNGNISEEAATELGSIPSKTSNGNTYTLQGWSPNNTVAKTYTKFNSDSTSVGTSYTYYAMFESAYIMKIGTTNTYYNGTASGVNTTWVAGTSGSSTTVSIGRYNLLKKQYIEHASTTTSAPKFTATYNGTTLSISTNTRYVYFKPSSGWKNDGARFAAYFFGNGDTWYSLLPTGDTDIYYAEVRTSYSNLIFVRMNGSNSVNNWDNAWNQTADLNNYQNTITTTNMFTVDATTQWNKPNKTWSVYTGKHGWASVFTLPS